MQKMEFYKYRGRSYDLKWV